MPENNDESTAFLRQRRDLFVISAILLLIPIAEIKSTGNFSLPLLGIAMSIGKPQILMQALWIMWIYWYFRCFQSYKNLSRDFVSEGFHSCINKYIYYEFDKEYKKITPGILKRYADSKDININELSIQNSTPSNLTWEYASRKIHFTFTPLITRSVNNEILHNYKKSETLQLGWASNLWIRTRAALDLIFTKLEFTEYYFPFIFGLLPIIHKVYTQIIRF
ncbi:MAG: hypothetical protein Q8R74_01795 [Methylophilus sp.]|nr:hypothetical protein [Methylophilus sp.]